MEFQIDPEMEKLILLKEKKKEQQQKYDAKRYPKIKEQKLLASKKQYQEKTKPRITALNLKIEAYQIARWEKEQAIREKIESDKVDRKKIITLEPVIESEVRSFFKL